MVRVVAMALPLGVRVAGEKVHVVAAGSPEQEKVVGELNPPPGSRTIAVETDWPAVTVISEGPEASENPPAGFPAVTVTVAFPGSRVASPG